MSEMFGRTDSIVDHFVELFFTTVLIQFFAVFLFIFRKNIIKIEQDKQKKVVLFDMQIQYKVL